MHNMLFDIFINLITPNCAVRFSSARCTFPHRGHMVKCFAYILDHPATSPQKAVSLSRYASLVPQYKQMCRTENLHPPEKERLQLCTKYESQSNIPNPLVDWMLYYQAPLRTWPANVRNQCIKIVDFRIIILL